MEEQGTTQASSGAAPTAGGSLKIRGKILLGFITILVLTIVIAAVALIGQRYTNKTVDQVINVQNKKAQLSLEAQSYVQQMQLDDREFRLHLSAAGLQTAKDVHLPSFFQKAAQAQDTVATLSRLETSEAGRKLAQQTMDVLNNYATSFVSMVNNYDQRYNLEYGSLVQVEKIMLEFHELMARQDFTLKEAVMYHELEEAYRDYQLTPATETAAQLKKTIGESIQKLNAMGLDAAHLADWTKPLNLMNKWVDESLKVDADINVQIAIYEESASKVTPILTSLRNRALEEQAVSIEQLAQNAKNIFYIVLGVSALAILLGLILALRISKGLTRQVDSIMELLSNLGIGDFSAKAKIVSSDELGEMAASLNAMLENLTMLIQTQDERDRDQESIMKLMMEISELTEGDLTARAEVTEDITGAIADSFNSMAEEFGGIVRQVQRATSSVDATTTDISRLTSDLAVRSIDQNRQVNNAIDSINQIAESIRQVSQNATRSAEVSLSSRMNAREGAAAVEQTNRAMDEIREQINETARSIKRLGESSMEIGNVVEIINNIADRTSILALNASIQAAMAGEAGHGFAVVAEEVQRLAESSSNSTQQIDNLVKSIQAEIKDVSSRMDESIGKVVQGSKLADGAYGKLQEIESVSNQLADLIESITRASASQVQMSEDVVRSMVAVGEMSTSTSDSSQETAELMISLNETAGQLREAVGRFKIEAVG